MTARGSYSVRIEEGGAEAAALLVYELRNLGFTVEPYDEAGTSSYGFQVAPPLIGTAHSLVESSAFTQAVLDQVGDPVLACDAQGRLRLLNEAARRIHPMPEEPTQPAKWGSQLSLYRPGEGTPLSQDETPLIRALQGEVIKDLPLVLQQSDHEPREGLSSARAIYSGQGELLGAVAVFRDLTEQKHAERALARQVALYEALSETNQFLVTDPDPQAVYDAICRILVDHGGFELAWVGMPDSEGWIQPVASFGAAQGYLRELAISTDPYRPEGQGPTGVTLREGEATISRRILEDVAMTPWLEAAQAHGLRSSGAFPIRRGGHVVAALNVYAADPDFLDEGLLHLLDELVLDVSFALDNFDRREHTRLLEGIVEASPDVIGVADTDGYLQYHNPKGRAALDPNMRTGHISDFHPPWAARKVIKEGLPYAREHGSWQGETAFLDTEGREWPFSQIIVAHYDDSDTLTHYSTIARDLGPIYDAQQRIHTLTYHNEVSGLPNRTFMRERLNSELQRLSRERQRAAFILVDLDGFKGVNDSLGNRWGDHVLAEAGIRLQQAAGEKDLVAHLGADEFAILVPSLDPDDAQAAQEAEELAHQLQEGLHKPLPVDDHTLQITASVAVALFPREGEDDVDGILQKAGAALVQAQEAGPGAVRMAQRSLVDAARRRLDLEGELRRALDQGQLHPVFQPIWDLDGEHLAGFECLARWHHPDRGPISPGEFIPLAEETGLIHDLGSWILVEAAEFLTAASTAVGGRLPMGVSVNVSPAQFARPQFGDEIRSTLARIPDGTGPLKLEITENLLMQNLDTAFDRMCQLRESGAGFALDDFGTGFSSLAYLNRLPLDTLKIDRAIVDEIRTHTAKSPPIVESILALGGNLGMGIVAEGVETPEQSDFLKQRGGVLGQGFLWQPPIERDATLRLVDGGKDSAPSV